MKRAILSLALLSLSVPAAAQSSQFDFLGFRTDIAAPPLTKLAGKKCKVAQSGVSRCTISAGAVLGRARPLELTVTFNNARMIMVTGFVFPGSYAALIEAFETKYGPPTSSETRKWQNRLGTFFDNLVQKWTFSDGMLELTQRSEMRDIATFTFVANSNLPVVPKHEKPPINF